MGPVADGTSVGRDFTFHHLETHADVEQFLELMRQVFGQNSRVDIQVKRWIEHHPTMTLKDYFIIKHNERTVAGLNLIPLKWEIGGVPLKVAEMGCVATLPEHSRHGLQRRLIQEYHGQVAERGYDLSAIEGIPYFYRQFGYEYALPLLEETRIGLDKIPACQSRHTIRPFNDADIAEGMNLLTRSQQKFYVHAIRDEAIWRMHQESGMVAEYVFEGYAVEERGEMVAYFRISENPSDRELILREVTDVDQSTGQSILRFLRDLGKERGLETLVATTSYHDPFTDHLAAIGGVKRNPPYAWQIRVTDHLKMFQKMGPLFEKRLAASTHCNMTEKLNFNFRRFTIQMAIESGVIVEVQRLETNEDRTLGLNPEAFTQLLLGHRGREELELIYPDFRISGSHRPLVDVLFPKMPSYIHAAY